MTQPFEIFASQKLVRTPTGIPIGVERADRSLPERLSESVVGKINAPLPNPPYETRSSTAQITDAGSSALQHEHKKFLAVGCEEAGASPERGALVT